MVSDLSWNWIWKLPVSENIKLFIWLAFHNSVPTRSVLHHRNISPTEWCCKCQGVEEALLHCIRDCPLMKRIWVNLDFSDDSFFQQTNVHLWLKQGAIGSRNTLFLACVWWAWKSRNAKSSTMKTSPFSAFSYQFLTWVKLLRFASTVLMIPSNLLDRSLGINKAERESSSMWMAAVKAIWARLDLVV